MNETERVLVALVIGYRIRTARRSLHLSQAQLAHGIGSQSMISLLESGLQLPASDVLRLIAGRLQDPSLQSYAQLLNTREWSFDDFAADNRTLLIEALRTHRGRWLDVHSKLALQLCEHFYAERIFKTVTEICRLIMNHHTSESAYYEACFYYGSAFLFSHDYESALEWLSLAAERNEVLEEGIRSRLWYNLAYAHLGLDRFGTALWYAKLSVETFLRLDDYPHHAKSLGLLGVIQGELGRLEDAKRTLEHAYEMMTRWDVDETDRMRVANSIADVCESLGDLTAAEHWCEVVIESGRTEPDKLTVSAAHQTLCLVHMARKETEQAVKEAHLAIAMAKQAGDARVLCHAQLLAASVADGPQVKISLAESAYLTAQKLGHSVEEAFTADCLAEFLSACHPERAHHYRAEALRAYRAYFMEGSMWSSAFRYLRFGDREGD